MLMMTGFLYINIWKNIYNSKFRQTISLAKYIFVVNLRIHPEYRKVRLPKKREAGYKKTHFYIILSFILNYEIHKSYLRNLIFPICVASETT
jgi:hypothetical protein